MFLSRSLGAQMVKNLPAMQKTLVRSLGWEDPLEGGSGYMLQYSGLENFMDRGAWWAPVQGVARSQSEWHLGDVSEVLGCLKVGPGGVETAALGGMPHPCSVPVFDQHEELHNSWFPSNPVQFWKRKLIYVELIYSCPTSGWIIYWSGACPTEEAKSTVLA